MSSTEISPGPWELVKETEHHGPYVCSASGLTVCDLYAMTIPSALSSASGGPSRPIFFPDAEANARLIAAAPDLLKALKVFARATPAYAKDPSTPDHGECAAISFTAGDFRAALDAIAKAEGRK